MIAQLQWDPKAAIKPTPSAGNRSAPPHSHLRRNDWWSVGVTWLSRTSVSNCCCLSLGCFWRRPAGAAAAGLRQSQTGRFRRTATSPLRPVRSTACRQMWVRVSCVPSHFHGRRGPAPRASAVTAAASKPVVATSAAGETSEGPGQTTGHRCLPGLAGDPACNVGPTLRGSRPCECDGHSEMVDSTVARAHVRIGSGAEITGVVLPAASRLRERSQ